MRQRAAACVAAMVVLASCGVSSAIASADPPAPPPPPPPPAPKTTIDHDGRYTVGTDIVPGNYSSAGPLGDGTCYWKRLGGPGGNDILDNALTKKPQVVQILPTDAAFKTDGCQQWQITDAPPPPNLPPAIAGAQLPILIGQLPKP